MLDEENKPSLVLPAIIAIFFIVAAIYYYLNSDYYQTKFPEGRTSFDYSGRPTQQLSPKSSANQIILRRNVRYETKKNFLVYKGIEAGHILVDLYIADLDPEQPYRKKYHKKKAEHEMLLGEERYRLVSSTKNALVLKDLSDRQRK